MSDPEIVALHWTTSGPIREENGRNWSLFDFRDRCAAAQRAGFAGIGIWHADLAHVLESRSLREVKVILDAHGLDRIELEFLKDWFLDDDDQRRATSDEVRGRLFDAAATLGAHHIKVGNTPGVEFPIDLLTERFAQLCADAARRHDALVAYEFMPFDTNVRDVEQAAAVVGGAGAANGVVALDTWHLAKLGISPDDLAQLPPELLGWVELSDGQREDSADLLDEAMNHRNFVGEGDFDVVGYIRECRRLGYGGPWGVEVLSEELRDLPIDEIFGRAFETTARGLAAAV
jgi:sugar phosphate isomerase/epimerase